MTSIIHHQLKEQNSIYKPAVIPPIGGSRNVEY